MTDIKAIEAWGRLEDCFKGAKFYEGRECFADNIKGLEALDKLEKRLLGYQEYTCEDFPPSADLDADHEYEMGLIKTIRRALKTG